MKFKPWDKVRCMNNSWFVRWLTMWKEYVVENPISWCLWVPSDNWLHFVFNWDERRFHLVGSSQENEDRQSSDSTSFRYLSSLTDSECIHCKTKEQAEYICKLIVNNWLECDSDIRNYK